MTRVSNFITIIFLCTFLLACRNKEGNINILLITVDTLRADHLPFYGYSRNTAPFLSQLAKDGVLFEYVWAQWPKTTPSFASIFTASYGRDHGVVNRTGIPLPCEYKTLAEILDNAGYTTLAVVANGAAGSDFFFNQGFDYFIEPWKKSKDPQEIERLGRAEATTNIALELANKIDTKESPYFFWIHYLDPHFPYDPPETFKNKFQEDELFSKHDKKIFIAKTKRRQLGGIGYTQVMDGKDNLAFYIARYDAEIYYTDFWIKKLFEGLQTKGLLNNTLVIFTSDHGESLGDHEYYFDHGRFAYDASLRVPLFFYYPKKIAPKRIPENTVLLNIAPTILEYVGIQNSWNRGISLKECIENKVCRKDPIFAEAGYSPNDSWQKSIKYERFKLILAPNKKVASFLGDKMVLFDIENDPAETKNVIEQYPEQAKKLKTMLSQWIQSKLVPEKDRSICPSTDPSSSTIKQLKALGYL